jgi:hypothetical protein
MGWAQISELSEETLRKKITALLSGAHAIDTTSDLVGRSSSRGSPPDVDSSQGFMGDPAVNAR